MKYEEFAQELSDKIKSDDEFYYELLTTVIKNPRRYTGIFRVSNAKTKLVQNVTQSREIKFGDFMEDVITSYIAEMGYENLDKRISDSLKADQLFTNGRSVCLIEQKIRDDHDSTKKRGQYDNFQRKYTAIREKYPNHEIIAVMWFIDDALKKNNKYYIERAETETLTRVKIYVLYDGDLFVKIFARPDVWDEVCKHLRRNKSERTDEILNIPDFDTSPEIRRALHRLKAENKNLYAKLLSSKPEYVQLRAELFPTGENLRLS